MSWLGFIVSPSTTNGSTKWQKDKSEWLKIKRRTCNDATEMFCRELAVVAGAQGNAADPVKTAEAIVSAVATDAQHDARFGRTDENKTSAGETPSEVEAPQ